MTTKPAAISDVKNPDVLLDLQDEIARRKETLKLCPEIAQKIEDVFAKGEGEFIEKSQAKLATSLKECTKTIKEGPVEGIHLQIRANRGEGWAMSDLYRYFKVPLAFDDQYGRAPRHEISDICYSDRESSEVTFGGFDVQAFNLKNLGTKAEALCLEAGAAPEAAAEAKKAVYELALFLYFRWIHLACDRHDQERSDKVAASVLCGPYNDYDFRLVYAFQGVFGGEKYVPFPDPVPVDPESLDNAQLLANVEKEIAEHAAKIDALVPGMSDRIKALFAQDEEAFVRDHVQDMGSVLRECDEPVKFGERSYRANVYAFEFGGSDDLEEGWGLCQPALMIYEEEGDGHIDKSQLAEGALQLAVPDVVAYGLEGFENEAYAGRNKIRDAQKAAYAALEKITLARQAEGDTGPLMAAFAAAQAECDRIDTVLHPIFHNPDSVSKLMRWSYFRWIHLACAAFDKARQPGDSGSVIVAAGHHDDEPVFTYAFRRKD